MNEKPKKSQRRWLQFSLSTWLILVTILGWGMASRPYRVPLNSNAIVGVSAPDVFGQRLSIPFTKPARTSFFRTTRDRLPALNPRLRWPALALVVFIGWKCYGLAEQRREQVMQSTENGVAIKTPKKQWRRRLEIALSGWIVLPLLVCCAIQQPMRIVETKTVTTPFYYSPPPPEIPGWFRHGDFSGHGRYLFSRRRLNPRAVLTCTAIVAFISWKAFANFHSKQAHHAR